MSTFEFLQLLGIISSLAFVGFQIRLQSQELRDQGKLQGFQLYHLLVQQYAELLNRADEDTELNQIWEEPDEARMAQLEAAQEARDWGAWYEMNEVEKRCYRYTRYAVETFEQAYLVHDRGWIDGETWHKWRGWMRIWKDSRYFRFVFEDTKPRLVESFVKNFDSVAKVPGPRMRSTFHSKEYNG